MQTYTLHKSTGREGSFCGVDIMYKVISCRRSRGSVWKGDLWQMMVVGGYSCCWAEAVWPKDPSENGPWVKNGPFYGPLLRPCTKTTNRLFTKHCISWKSWIPWNLSFRYIHCTGQFTPKMKANAEPRLLSSLVWIDQYNECTRMTSFMEFMC